MDYLRDLSEDYPLDTQFYPINFIRPKKAERNVFDRLTDHQFYTGIHKERFDEFGIGRGLAGREYLYLDDGMTESASRCHEVYSTTIKLPRKPVVEEGTLGVQKFGVQTVTPKLIWLYRNGDKYHNGVDFFVKKHIKTLNTLYQEATKLVKPVAGPIRCLYDQNLKLVTDLCEIVDGGKYLCTSGEPPTHIDRLEKFLNSWVYQDA